MKRYKQARRRCEQVVRDFFKNVSWLDAVFVHEDNPKRMSHLDYMLYHFEEEFYHDYELKRNATLRLMPLFCRLAFECGFQQSNPKPQKLLFLKRVLELLLKKSNDGVINLSDIDIYNTSYDDLEKEYGTHIEKKNELTRLVVENGQWVRNEDYEIIEVVNYKMAHEYADYCDLCYLRRFETWINYANYGTSKVYLILHKDWKNVEKKHDVESANSPYDTYGRSMIFVFVDAEGNLAYCNTRWNHDATYDAEHSTDHALDEREISEIVGVNFYEVFKPKAKNLEDDPVYRLSKGDDIDDIFDSVELWVNGLRAVGLNERFNVLNEKNELISPGRWFKSIENMTEDGQIIVRTFDDFVTILNRDGTQLLEDYYLNIHLHGCRSYYVAWDFNYNAYIINKNGEVVSSYDKTKTITSLILHDSNGVMTNNYMVFEDNLTSPTKSLFIYSEDGKIIFESTIKNRTIRNNGWVIFLSNGGVFYHVSGDGKILGKSKEFKDINITEFSKCWLIGETTSGGYVLLNNQLERISDEYGLLKNGDEFRGRYLLATKSKNDSFLSKFIDEHGKLLLPQTIFIPSFVQAYYTNEYAVVKIEDVNDTAFYTEGYSFLKSDGTVTRINKEWWIMVCHKKCAVVVKCETDDDLSIGEKIWYAHTDPTKFLYNLIDYDGNLLLDEWCECIEYSSEFLALTTSNGKQLLTSDLKPFFDDNDIKLKREDGIFYPYNKKVCVVRDGKCAYFDENGRWMFDKMWFDELVSLSTIHAVTNYVGDKVYKLCPNGKVKEIKELQ